jgi:hypothetical protein
MTDYGNIPEEDVEAVQYAVHLAIKVANSLPPVVPQEWRPAAYQHVLDALLRDWVKQGASEPADDDAEDLVSLLRLACDVALVQEGALREVTFRTVLKNTMDDWVENWQDEDDDEPEGEEIYE